MSDYKYTDADWRENAKYGLVGVTTDDATAHWDRWLAAHDAALIEGLADKWEALVQREKPPVRGSLWLREKARQRREEQP